MERDNIFSGIKLGEHSFNPENMMEEITERAVKRGNRFVYFRPQGSLANISEDYILSWVKYLADNEIYFFFGNTVQAPPPDRKCQLTKETVAKIKEIAGKYSACMFVSVANSPRTCFWPLRLVMLSSS